MNHSRLKFMAILVLLVAVAGCDKEQESPEQINNSVVPQDFLSDKTYTTLKIEISYVEGFQPTITATNNLVSFLESRLNKSSIQVVQHSMPSPGRLSMDVDVIRSQERIHRQQNTSGSQLTVYIMFVDAEYSQSTATSKVLGVAYGPSSICVFGKNIRDFTGGVGKPSAASLESVILGHEFGHLLGLVNNGVSMVAPHQDTAHSRHCTDTRCLMYYKAETNGIAGDIMGSIPTLDANCLADLKAAGGK